MNEQKSDTQTSIGRPDTYQAYLVRLWRDSQTDPWRVTVRSVLSTEHLQFADLESMCAYLQRQTTIEKNQIPIIHDQGGT